MSRNTKVVELGPIVFTVILFLLAISTGLPTSSETSQPGAAGFNFVINPNITCGQNYKNCIDDVRIDNLVDLSRVEESYVEACNRTLQCTSMYFECRMARDNSTSSESPMEYPAVQVPSFKNPFQSLVD